MAVGDTVTTDQRIAQVGSSGNSSDPHLHFEVWFGSLYHVDLFNSSCGNNTTIWSSPTPYDSLFFVWTSGLTNFIPYLDTLREEPPTVDTFSSMDTSINYWNLMTGLRTGDVLDIEWYNPNSHLWFTFVFNIDRDWWYYYFWEFYRCPSEPSWTMGSNSQRNGLKIDTKQFIVSTTISTTEQAISAQRIKVYYHSNGVQVSAIDPTETPATLTLLYING